MHQSARKQVKSLTLGVKELGMPVEQVPVKKMKKRPSVQKLITVPAGPETRTSL